MDFNYERPTFQLDGITFRFKKSSPKNAQKVFEYQKELVNEYSEKVDEVMEGEGNVDEFENQNIESMKEMVRLIAEPTEHESADAAFEEIRWQEVDQHKVQEAMKYFLS